MQISLRRIVLALVALAFVAGLSRPLLAQGAPTQTAAGQPYIIERTEEHGRTCDYYAQPVSPAQQQERMRKALEEIQTRSKQHAADAATQAGDAAAAARASGVENLTKNLVAGANPGSGPYFSIQVNQNGRAQIAGMKIALGAVSPGMRTVEPISGIGDDAVMGPMDSMLVFTKNGLGVQIDLRQMPQGRDHAIAMAQRILPRL